MRSWAREPDMWIRRAAILAQLGARERTDTALLSDVVEANLLGTRYGDEFFIRKAIGWALRDYAPTDMPWVVARADALGDRLAPLSRREALKHPRA